MMINLVAGLLGGRTWLAWLIVAGLGAAALGGAYAYVDHQGYHRADLEWTAKYQAREIEIDKARIVEADRQAAVNAAAKAAEREALAEKQTADARAIVLADQLAREAAADPNAGRTGLDAAAVDRLNRILE